MRVLEPGGGGRRRRGRRVRRRRCRPDRCTGVLLDQLAPDRYRPRWAGRRGIAASASCSLLLDELAAVRDRVFELLDALQRQQVPLAVVGVVGVELLGQLLPVADRRSGHRRVRRPRWPAAWCITNLPLGVGLAGSAEADLQTARRGPWPGSRPRRAGSGRARSRVCSR